MFKCYDSCGLACFTSATNYKLMLFTNKYSFATMQLFRKEERTTKHIWIQNTAFMHLLSKCVCIHTMWQDQMCLYLSSQWNVLNPSPGQIRYQLYWCVWPQPCCVWWFKSCDTIHLPTVHNSWQTSMIYTSASRHKHPYKPNRRYTYVPKVALPQSYHVGWGAHTHSVNIHFLLGQGL